MSTSSLIMTTGDLDPFTYGGGLVFFHESDREDYYVWVVWETSEDEEEDDEVVRRFTIHVPADVLAWHDSIDLDTLQLPEDVTLTDLRRMSCCGSIEERIAVLQCIRDVWGLEGLDEEWAEETIADLRAEFEGVLDTFLEAQKRIPSGALQQALMDLKVAEDALRDHEPELGDWDLSRRAFRTRVSLRNERDRQAKIITDLGRGDLARALMAGEGIPKGW